MNQVIIIGAGSVGANAALALKEYGYDVILIDHADDILAGAAQVTCVNHGDGFEYYEKDHTVTGYDCIDGAMTKGLIYPLGKLHTEVCDASHPIRFFLTLGTVHQSNVVADDFHRNVEAMRAHFEKQFNAVAAARNWSVDDAEKHFLRVPQNFCRLLEADEYSDTGAGEVIVAYAGSSFGINMPNYYACVKAALRKYQIDCRFNAATESIEKTGGRYKVHAGGCTFSADHVLLCAGNQIPALSDLVCNEPRINRFSGTFYLNSMTYLKLPATSDARVLEQTHHINFALKQEHGGMFACLVPPTPSEEGYAAVYYPSPKGSQRRVHIYKDASFGPTPDEWECLIKEGIRPEDDPNLPRIMHQMEKLYPFLRGYAKVDRTECRPVFNPANDENDHGLKRSIRAISAVNGPITEDERVTAWSAPKWTNAELVALMAVDHVIKDVEGKGLPKDKYAGCGPTNIHVAEVTERFCLQNLAADIKDARKFARKCKLPERIIG